MVIDTPTLVPVLAYGLLYALLVRRRSRVYGRVDRRRAATYALGLVVILGALASPLDSLADDGSMVAHMVQHELIGNVAPILLLLGLDAGLARPVTRQLFGPAVHSARGRHLLRLAANPVLALGLYIGAMWLWYIPGVYQTISASSVLHPLGHILFVLTGLLFWFHVLRPLPALVTLTPAQKLLYLLIGMVGGSVVAAVLIGAPQALYGASLENQRLAGAVMMGVEMPLALGAALWVFLRAAARERLWSSPQTLRSTPRTLGNTP
jgi:putative membrane protein